MGEHVPTQTTKSKVDGLLSDVDCVREDISTVLKVQQIQALALGAITKALERLLYITAGTLAVGVLCLSAALIAAVR